MKGNLRIGEWLFEAELHQLTGPEGCVHLEPRTTSVLLELASHAGQVRTREELLDAVWGETFVGEAALTHCIWELRKAFRDDAKNPCFIQTVPRRGYRLVAPVLQPPTVVTRAIVASTLGLESVPGTGGLEKSDSEPEILLGQVFEEVLKLHSGVPAEVSEETVEATVEAKGETRFALFERPTSAVGFALELQSRVAGTSIGIHLGEVEVEAQQTTDDLSPSCFAKGLAVGLAQSLHRLAGPRQTLTSRSIFDVARVEAEAASSCSAQWSWLAHGDYLFSGTVFLGSVFSGAVSSEAVSEPPDPVEVFEVGVEGFAPLRAPREIPGARPVGLDRTIPGWRPAPGLTIPQRPHWQLQRKLGEGGFGEVWLTQHSKTGDDRVFKFCVEVDRLRALQREVTLFRLLKDNLGGRRDITRILDWNFDEAPYFLEMEYISGGSLGDWAETQGGLGEVPLATRLEIVAQAGEALAAAHSIGVLHKDVKPGNLLIGPGRGEQPRVLLSDFGISRLTDPSRLLEAGITAVGLTELDTISPSSSQSGTRLYLAPEILEGKIATIQTDLYALGVVLYQAVAGGFDRALAPGWQRNITDPLLREDIARCVDLAPERRPRSGLEIAEGLRNLEERRARREEEERQRAEAEANRLALERAQRRRKWLLGTTALALCIATTVTVLTLIAMKARDKAQESREQAEKLVSFMLGDLRGTLEGVGRLDAMEGAATEVLSYYSSLEVDEMSDQGLVRRVTALRQIGEVRAWAGAFPDSEAAFEEAARAADSLVARDPQRGDWRADQADSHFWVGSMRHRTGDLVGAREAFEAHRSIYQDLAEQDPSQSEWRLELAYGHGNVGMVLTELGEIEEALVHGRQRLEVVRQLVEEQPEDQTLLLALAASHQRLGQALEGDGDFAGAVESYQADHDILLRLAEANPEDARIQDRLATSAGAVGIIHWFQGNPVVARPYWELEAEVFGRLCALDDQNTRWQLNRGIATYKVGQTLQAAGDSAAALEAFQAGRSLFEELVAKDPTVSAWKTGLANSHRLVAGLHLALGNTLQARLEVDRGAGLLRDVLLAQPDHRPTLLGLGSVLVLRGKILLAAEKPELAQASWESALALVEPLAQDSSELPALDAWGRVLIALGRRAEAQPILDRLRERGYRPPGFVAFCRQFGVEP